MYYKGRKSFENCKARAAQLPIFHLGNPAPGARHYSTGVLGGVGNSGRSWSSTVIDYRSYFLDFYSTLIYPGFPTYRTQGLHVRCLRE